MAKITDLSQLDMDGTDTYADYLTWQFDEAVELIQGKIMLMSPAPNVQHQRISVNLTGILYQLFKNTDCRLFAAPFDVRLFDVTKSKLATPDIYTVVQPDLCVAINWMRKAVLALLTGLLRFYRKGIPTLKILECATGPQTDTIWK